MVVARGTVVVGLAEDTIFALSTNDVRTRAHFVLAKVNQKAGASIINAQTNVVSVPHHFVIVVEKDLNVKTVHLWDIRKKNCAILFAAL